ncbi:unnamed protein product [Phytomonas sp. Hart1]|nr:unnamed protein product [Phytomonas sp. Hart1]|eukprot:CCW66967.1 unnamed protein product [Phytomonas sp. isolate Hart1]
MNEKNPKSNGAEIPLAALPALENESLKGKIPLPHWEELPHSHFSGIDGTPSLQNVMLHFLRQGRLSKEDAISLSTQAAILLRKEQNTLMLQGPVTVIGDIQGQFYDLVKIFSFNGKLADSQYLFLGNYIGGGGYSCECILFLFAAKLAYPNSIFLLRGNHESRMMASILGFELECSKKYSAKVFNSVMVACQYLPLSAVVSERYFCVHGGLSPDISSIEDINFIHRFREVPTKGAMCDLLWSDPYWDVENPSSAGDGQTDYYKPGAGVFDRNPIFYENERRGVSFLFNFACVRHFTSVNKILCIVRSHEAQNEGYKLYRPHPNTNFPCMLSLFSAPNYCGTFDNKGAFAHLTENNVSIRQFFCSPHPYELQNLNGITWSLPFVADSLQGIIFELFAEKK